MLLLFRQNFDIAIVLTLTETHYQELEALAEFRQICKERVLSPKI